MCVSEYESSGDFEVSDCDSMEVCLSFCSSNSRSSSKSTLKMPTSFPPKKVFRFIDEEIEEMVRRTAELVLEEDEIEEPVKLVEEKETPETEE